MAKDDRKKRSQNRTKLSIELNSKQSKSKQKIPFNKKEKHRKETNYTFPNYQINQKGPFEMYSILPFFC